MRLQKNKQTTCVTFEQAKKLKLIGFNEPTKVYFWGDGSISIEEELTYQQHQLDGTPMETFSAPTIEAATLWLNNLAKHGQLFKELREEFNSIADQD